MKKSTIQAQKVLTIVSVVLFLIKIIAWYMTHSVAILTDALESIVNVAAGFIGLYSIILSSKPKDKEHPYGHGKVEFISSAIEGILISVAGLFIIYKAIDNLWHPHRLYQLDYGLILVGITAVLNYVVGHFAEQKGKEEKSPILIASGAHLKSDTYSTLGLLLGLVLIIVTNLNWIDSIAALIFAVIIIYTGYKIIRKAIAGIMDESDQEIITKIVTILNNERNPHWIDIHNMRVINYAGFYHIDCHLTVAYYLNVMEAHEILDTLTDLLQKHFQDKVEFFIHVDGCRFTQCSLCAILDCPVRQHAFVRQIKFTNENVLSNQQHVG